MYRENYRSLRERAKELFENNPAIRCPFFDGDVVLNAVQEYRRIWQPIGKVGAGAYWWVVVATRRHGSPEIRGKPQE
jgi:hypothetical protein